jgi:hypothetical protein
VKIICISAKAQHGKDTVAEMIQDELQSQGKRVLIAHYADLLKHICRTFFNWNGEKDDAGRTILQRVGTDVVRKQRPDFWVEFIVDILNLFPEDWDYVLIPDTRFLNEIEYLKEVGFDSMLVRVIRDNFDSGLSEDQLNHPSETALDYYNYDYIIENNTDLQGLRDNVNIFVNEVYENNE